MDNSTKEIEKLQERISKIEDRNKKVEADKAWETSNLRRFSIAILTYFIVVSFFFAIDAQRPFINALVPTAGFILSTLSLPIAKNLWTKVFYKKS